MIDWITETPIILAESAKHRLVDPCLVMAIRRQEAGRPGRDFGVLSVSAPTYNEQLRVCCNTIAHRLFAYHSNPLVSDGAKGVKYSDAFIRYLGSIWAPVGSENDPTNLNTYWPEAVIKFYGQFIEEAKAHIARTVAEDQQLSIKMDLPNNSDSN